MQASCGQLLTGEEEALHTHLLLRECAVGLDG